MIVATYTQNIGSPISLKKTTHIVQISHAWPCALGCNICFLSQGEQSKLHGNKLEKKKKKDLALPCFTFHPMSPCCLLKCFSFIFNLHNKVKNNVKSSIYCGSQLWHQGSATWGKGGGSLFFLWDSHTAQHLGVPREPLNATEPHTAVANVGNKQITLAKQKKGLFFLTKISTQQKI